MHELKKLDIRYTVLQDEQILHSWLSKPENNYWFPMASEKEIDTGVKNWIYFSKYKAALTAVIDQVPCGMAVLFLMPYKKVSHHCFFYIIVPEEYRNLGIGGSLLKNTLHLAKNYFHLESIHCEIFEGCPLLPLLQKLQFEQFAMQEKYVKEVDGYRARILFERTFPKEGI